MVPDGPGDPAGPGRPRLTPDGPSRPRFTPDGPGVGRRRPWPAVQAGELGGKVDCSTKAKGKSGLPGKSGLMEPTGHTEANGADRVHRADGSPKISIVGLTFEI